MNALEELELKQESYRRFGDVEHTRQVLIQRNKPKPKAWDPHSETYYEEEVYVFEEDRIWTDTLWKKLPTNQEFSDRLYGNMGIIIKRR